MNVSGFLIFTLVLVVVAVLFAFQSVKVVPQQTAWVVERLGKFHAVLTPGLNFIIPFIDRVAYRHSLKEIPLDTPSQVCITRDNTQLTVDGVLFFQVTDPQRASYGTSNYVVAITQLAQTTLRSVVAASEGRKLEQINLATGAREAAIAQSEGEKQAEINKAEGQAAATLTLATATAEALRRVAAATQAEGGMNAVNLQVAEKYVEAFSQLAKTNNTLIVPGNLGDISGMIASAMKIVDGAKAQLPPKA